MSEPYLILHRVRGEPAFDIAEQLECPRCRNDSYGRTTCETCDGVGFWWIIPTSGHRAYPWHAILLSDIAERYDQFLGFNSPFMPEGQPDHYQIKPLAPPSFSISSILNSLVPKLRR